MPRTRAANPQQAKMQAKSLLMSLHPRFAYAVFAGTKQVELRKVRPRVEQGDQVIIYCTKPTAAILGVVRVKSVVVAPPRQLWTSVSDTCAVSRTEFFQYFKQRRVAYAIVVTEPIAFKAPITLPSLRAACQRFTPPQSYWYLQHTRLRDKLLLDLVASHNRVPLKKRKAA